MTDTLSVALRTLPERCSNLASEDKAMLERAADEIDGRESSLREAMKMVQAMKDRTDGPKRDDWQLGYAAACREINALLREMLLHSPEAKRLPTIAEVTDAQVETALKAFVASRFPPDRRPHSKTGE